MTKAELDRLVADAGPECGAVKWCGKNCKRSPMNRWADKEDREAGNDD